MVAVAMFAIPMGIVAWSHRREAEFRRIMMEHLMKLPEEMISGPIRPDRDPKTRYHRGMFVKYERAARYPWLPVMPDSPEPK
jgi:hypothetical protein